MENKENIFDKLYKIDVSAKISKKDKLGLGLSYLSWSDAWAELKKVYPDATYKIYTRMVKTTTTITSQEGKDIVAPIPANYNAEGQKISDEVKGDNTKSVITTVTTTETENEIPYFTDGNTCFVKVGVTIQGIEQTEIYPVMDYKNNSIKARSVTSVDVNKALQRAFVKACARHGLGLYIYSGEDLPEDKAINWKAEIATANATKIEKIDSETFEKYRNKIIDYIKGKGAAIPPEVSQYIASISKVRLGQATLEDSSESVQKIYTLISNLLAKE